MRGMVLAALFTLLAGMASAQTIGNGWWIQHPPFPVGSVQDVVLTDSTNLLVVTESGHVARSRDLGRSWDTLAVRSRHRLNGLAASGNIIVAVGDAGTVLRSFDGGYSWTTLASGTSAVLMAVTHVADRAWIAIGEGGTILRTSDDGAVWQPVSSGGTETLYGISLFNTSCMIAGANGLVLSSTDAGSTWTRRQTGVNDILRGVAMTGAADAFVAGYRRLLRTTDAGSVWQDAQRGEVLTDIAFADDRNGTAVGINGTVLRTRNGGTSWESVASGTIASLWAVDFAPDRLHGAIVGAGNTLLVTTNGGLTWTSRTRGDGSLWGVAFRSALEGVAVGERGRIVTTTDGGRHWIMRDAGRRTDLRAVSWAGARSIVAVGDSGRVLRSSDAGATWTVRTTNVSWQLMGVSMADSLAGFAVGERGTILQTRDGGSTWLARTSGSSRYLFGVDHIDAQTAVAVGEYGLVLRTTDGGNSWREQPCGTSEQLRSVSFTSVLSGTAVGSNGVIKRTTDGGETWIDKTRTDYQVSLFGVSFADANFGIAAGYYWPGLGSMIFTTSDGGANWQLETQGIKDHLWAVAAPAPGIGTAVGSNDIVLRRDLLYATEALAEVMPGGIEIGRNYPNPFAASTVVPFALGQRTHVTLAVHDMLGRRVVLLVDGELDAGGHVVRFDAASLPAGMYLCVLTSPTARSTRTILLTR